jgi:hypothetical protein
MNLQVNQALAELRDYKTILPLPCNLHEQHCKEICFTQQIFSVSHSQHTNDISKVSYRMIARKDFAESLCKADETAKYPVGRENYCRYTEQNEKVLDAYLLNDFINENNKIQTLKI